MPLEAPRVGSTVALARLGKRTVAYVLDEDDGDLHTVDVDTKAELSTTPLSGTPSQLLVAADGRVLVAIRDRARVEVLEPAADPAAPLTHRCAVPTAPEPVALAATPDDATVLVSSAWGHALAGYAAADLERRFEVSLPREPRGVVVSADGAKAYVAHVVGSRMSVVELGSRTARVIDLTGVEEPAQRNRGLLASLGAPDPKPRRACQGFALAKTVDPGGCILAPQVLVDPGDTEAPASGYGSGGPLPAEVASIAVIDAATDRPIEASLELTSDPRRVLGARLPTECLLPRAAAVDAAGGGLLVACLGIDAIVEYDALSADPRTAETRRWSVPAGPTGLAVDASGRRAVVWSQFDRAVSVVSLGAAAPDASPAAPARFALSRKAGGSATADLALGRRLFHAAGDLRISNDGRACASCHPDGRDDALTWATPDGPRQTPMLAGRLAKTAPYGWNGANGDVKEHLLHTFQRLRGAGLSDRELSSLIAYVTSLRGPGEDAADGGLRVASAERTRVARGQAIFHSSETGCAGCHGAETSFADGAVHDIGSQAKGDPSARFDTPSLRFVGGTAPYFHYGRYPTLRALLHGSDGKMGHTGHLSNEDVDALEAYLRSL